MLIFITMIHIDNVIRYYNDTYRQFFITMIHIDNNVSLYYNDTYRQCYSLLQ